MKKIIILALAAAGVAYGGAKLYLHHRVGEEVDAALKAMSAFVDVEYANISSTLSGELTLDDVKVRLPGARDEIHMARIGIDTPSFLSLLDLKELARSPMAGSRDMPGYVGVLWEDVSVPAMSDYYETMYRTSIAALGVDDADEAATECVGKYGSFSPRALAGLGYRELIMSGRVIVRQQDGQFGLELESDIDDMWDMTGSVTLVGNMLSMPRLENLRLEVTDRSLNARIGRYCAERGLSPEETAAAQLAAFNYVGESLGMVFDEYLLDPYAEFIAGKPTLVVTAEPHQPVSFAQFDLYKPSDIPALLNLTASTN